MCRHRTDGTKSRQGRVARRIRLSVSRYTQSGPIGEQLMVTKLTVQIPEELGRRVNARAALEGTTLSDVVRQHLEEFAAGLDVLEEADALRVIREIEAQLGRGEERV